MEKPLGQQLTESANGNPNAVGDGVSGFANSMGDSLNAAKESMGNTLNDFSSASAVGASGSFLEANSMIAKFVFLILVVVGFVVILKLGIMIMGFFIQPDPNPYIFKGMLDGKKTKTVSTNPTLTKDAVTILRSDDANSGLEYTWSIWLYIQDINSVNSQIQFNNVFVKGDGAWDKDTGLSKINNGPGMYIKNNSSNSNTGNKSFGTLHIVMDTVVNPGSQPVQTGQIQEIFDISNIPLNKWVHIALRQQNRIMDVYVNGTITMRNTFKHIPKQNYNDIIIAGNGGFNGQMSNLRYFSHALNVLELNSILAQGPNTTPLDGINGPGNMQYLSMNWYSTRT